MCNILRQVRQWLCSPTTANSVVDVYREVMLDRTHTHRFGAAVQDFASRTYQLYFGTSDNYGLISPPASIRPDWGEQARTLGLEIVPGFQYKWFSAADFTDIEPFNKGKHGVVRRAKYGDLDVIIKYATHPTITYNDVIEEAAIGVRMHDLEVGPDVIGLTESPDNRPGIIFKYYPGTITLAEFRDTINHYKASQVVNVAAAIAGHLSTMHKRGYLHNDITNRNIILIPDRQSDSKFQVKLIDFGSAVYKTTFHYSRNTTRLLRKYPHLAPELASGMPTNKMTEVFSYGHLINMLSEASRNRAVQRTLSSFARRCCMSRIESRPTMSTTNFVLLHKAYLIQKSEGYMIYIY